MTERGQPTDVAAACPFVAFEDERDERADRPDPRHRCYAENPPSPLSRAHQEAYCLSPAFAGCPIFREWARREAARVQLGAAREEPPVRLREEPARRDVAVDWTAEAVEPDEAAEPRRPPPPTFGSPVPERPPDTGPFAPQQGSWPGQDRRGAPDLPARQVQQGPWSQPPPWLANRGGTGPGTPGSGPAQAPPPAPVGEGNEGLDRLVARREDWAAGTPGAPRLPVGPAGYPLRSADERPPQRPNDPSQGLAGSIADESAAALASRLAAIGMSDADRSRAETAAAAAPPVAGPLGSPADDDPRYQDRSRLSAALGDGGVQRLPRADEIIGAAAMHEPPRSTGALSRILRWNRPPAAGDTRSRNQPPQQPRRGSEPAWERPRRYEAYPSMRRRVGLPSIPRVVLGAVALAIAAALLFFVPPMFIGGPGGGDEASPSAPAASASVGPSGSPTRPPGPTPRVYVVRSGDTLSRIAQRFGITVDEILAANPNIKNPNQIAIGDRITIPAPQPSEIVEPSEEPSASP